MLNLLAQRHPVTDEALYPPHKHIVWLDNLIYSVKLFERLRSLGIGAAGTVRTTKTKREEIGDEAVDVEKAVEENIQGKTTQKKKVAAENFSPLLTDLKISAYSLDSLGHALCRVI